MLISAWSSDVCSSDLLLHASAGGRRPSRHADRTRHGATHPGASALGSSGPVRGWHRRNAQDKPAARPWRRLRRLAGAAVVLLLLYGLGFLWFSTLLPSTGSGDERSTDAIVVLTGGSDRLAVALDLLSADKGRKLFVSGVYRGVGVRQLLHLPATPPP